MAKQNRKKGKVIQMLSPENYIKQKARSLPIVECWINSEWEEDGLANILVARKHTNGNCTVGMYLIDLKCLGVKNAQYFFNMSPAEYHDLLDQSRENMDIESVRYNLVHNIIYAGIEFAEDYGFHPHKDFTVAEYILEKDTDDIELIDIECGKDDKPLYVRGPLDSDQRAKQIIAQLEKTAGAGNYTVINGFDVPWDDDFDDEEFMSEDVADFSTEEKLGLLMDYISRADKLSMEEAGDLNDLIESILIEFINLEKADEYYENFRTKLDEFEVADKTPDEMFLDCAIPLEQLEAFKTDFEEVEKLISEGKKDARRKLKVFGKAYPENAAFQYLELFLLHTNESRKLGSVMEKAIQLYPNFPLINLFSKIHGFKNESDNYDIIVKPEVDLENILEKVFPNRKILYVSEVFYVVLYLVVQVAQTTNMEQLEALDNLIDEVNLHEEDVELLYGFIKMAKMTFIAGLAERLNDTSM
jgi:hypothetical protein